MCVKQMIIIIIINEEIIVAFSPKTTRTRYKVKNTKPRNTSCLAIWKNS